MRIVHTSDWHVGRRWKGTDRLREMEVVLRNLGDYVERERVDLVLHTGDLFDGRNPAGDAEDLVNRFFVRMSELKVPMVVIAGNHDDADRFDARSRLARFANVRILGRPRSAADGGTFPIETLGGEKAMVAALPFASVGQWLDALKVAGTEAAARLHYAHMFQKAVANLSQPFGAGTVNLLMAHTHLEGARFGDSERRVHVGEDWAATPQTLPAAASYIALGHIHLPQKVPGMLPAYYAGSPMQMDFGEVAQRKTFNCVTASPGQPAKIEEVAYEGAWPLLDLRGTLEELEAQVEQHRDGSWLRVTAVLAKPDPDLSRKVRELYPRALVVNSELPEDPEHQAGAPPPRATPRERYTAFHHVEHHEDPSGAVLAGFDELHAAESEPGT